MIAVGSLPPEICGGRIPAGLSPDDLIGAPLTMTIAVAVSPDSETEVSRRVVLRRWPFLRERRPAQSITVPHLEARIRPAVASPGPEVRCSPSLSLSLLWAPPRPATSGSGMPSGPSFAGARSSPGCRLDRIPPSARARLSPRGHRLLIVTGRDVYSRSMVHESLLHYLSRDPHGRSEGLIVRAPRPYRGSV